jgi:hypothetical protein
MEGNVLDSCESGQGQVERCRPNGGKPTGSKKKFWLAEELLASQEGL